MQGTETAVSVPQEDIGQVDQTRLGRQFRIGIARIAIEREMIGTGGFTHHQHKHSLALVLLQLASRLASSPSGLITTGPLNNGPGYNHWWPDIVERRQVMAQLAVVTEQEAKS
jgi:hypothetical protein